MQMVFVLEIKNYDSVKIVRMASLNNISLDTTRGGENIGEVSFEEQGLICQLTWQSWENLRWTLSCSEDKALKKVVANPQAWRENLASTVCVFSDAMPVYLAANVYVTRVRQ